MGHLWGTAQKLFIEEGSRDHLSTSFSTETMIVFGVWKRELFRQIFLIDFFFSCLVVDTVDIFWPQTTATITNELCCFDESCRQTNGRPSQDWTRLRVAEVNSKTGNGIWKWSWWWCRCRWCFWFLLRLVHMSQGWRLCRPRAIGGVTRRRDWLLWKVVVWFFSWGVVWVASKVYKIVWFNIFKRFCRSLSL